MIRIRETDGKVMVVDESYRFVEVCDMTGRVARVLYFDSHGVLHDVDSNSPEAARYKRAFHVDFIPVKPLTV